MPLVESQVPAPLEVSILNTNYTAGLIIRVSFRKVHYNSNPLELRSVRSGFVVRMATEI